MKNRGQQRIVRNRKAAVRKEPISWGYFILTIFCASIMALGFFLVAVQHFVAMDLGFKNSNLRKQVQDLEAEKRRLLLAKEVALSPAAITRAATKFGFRDVDEVIATNVVEPVTPTAPAATRNTVREITAIVSTKPTNQVPPIKKVEKPESTAPKAQTAEVKPGIESRPRRVQIEKETSAQIITAVAKLR